MRVASFWILSRFWRHRQMLDGLQLTPMWAVSSKKRWLIRNLAVCRVLHVLCLLWMPDWVDDSDSSELIFFCTCTHSENMQYIFPVFWFLPESETQASSSSICYLWLLCEITLLILGSERFLCTVPNGSRMRHPGTRNPQRGIAHVPPLSMSSWKHFGGQTDASWDACWAQATKIPNRLFSNAPRNAYTPKLLPVAHAHTSFTISTQGGHN